MNVATPPARGWKRLISHGPQHLLYTVSTCITLMIIKDRPGKPAAMLGQGAPMHFCIASLKSLVTKPCFEGESGESIFSPRRFHILFFLRILREFSLESVTIHLTPAQHEGLPA